MKSRIMAGLLAVIAVGTLLILDIVDVIDIPLVGRIPDWSIGIYVSDGDLLDFKEPEEVQNPVLTSRDVTDVDAEFIGDPFMIRKQELWFMFFEVFNRQAGQGDIGLASSRDGLRWTYRQIVIDAPTHLSYPYAFSTEDGDFILIGTSVEGKILVYKAVRFPTEWTLAAAILEGDYDDCSIFEHDGRYWLFACQNDTTLRLFHSEDLLEGWEEHRSSPLIEGNRRITRGGGRVVNAGGRIVRFAQDLERSYGRRVWAIAVEMLTPDSYRESVEQGPVIGATGRGWNSRGMHTIDPQRLPDGRWIACVDGLDVGRIVVFKKGY